MTSSSPGSDLFDFFSASAIRELYYFSLPESIMCLPACVCLARLGLADSTNLPESSGRAAFLRYFSIKANAFCNPVV